MSALERLVVMAEEPSMVDFLKGVLPSLLGPHPVDYIQFQGKQDLLAKAPSRLKGFAAYLPEGWRILVVVDRDQDHCVALKASLEAMAAAAGLITKTSAGPSHRFQVVNRIAIEELEAWYFGDWEAVRTAYPAVPATIPQRARFRDPDAIAGGTSEALEQILKRAGYFKAGLRKPKLAQEVAPHMNPHRNRSRSFQALVEAIQAVMQ